MESVINYARKYKKPILVEITGRDDSPRHYRMTVRQFEDLVKRHCSWYNTMVSSRVYGEYETRINLLNKISFNVTLF